MKLTPVALIAVGDKLESSSGIFTVTESRYGMDGAICLRGTVAGILTAWATYPEHQQFYVLTIH